ncbi:MAG: hypothetical protein IPP51_09225 [Bacteroidetes bacterium]|nr:hypothetical protein [Bacteroidota bacterium]
MQNMKEALISIIQSLISFNQIAIQSIKNTTSNHVDLLSNINTSINAQEIYETNEVQVNDIYYGTAAIGNGDDVAGYEATLLSIAQLCPLSDGPAVYHARALYSLIDPDQDYDDDISCVQNGYYFRMQQGVKHKSSVFPNPTSGDVTIVYKFQSEYISSIRRYVWENVFDDKAEGKFGFSFA